MKNKVCVWKRFLNWLFPCSHVCYLDELRKLSDGVTCACPKCGKILVADYGLAIECTWKQKIKEAK